LYVDAETIIDASPPIVAANMSRTPNMMKTQFMIHDRLKGLGLTIHNHIIHGNCNKNPTKKCIRKRKSSRHKSMTKCALLRANNKTMILVNGAKLLAYFIK
jgi:hypothetical protein